MKVNQKTKIGVLIALIILVIQLFSLFRSLPDVPACGKIQSLGHGARVLINCDSAVFMKDAQNPKRLFNGESVYQDRPLYALSNWLISTSLQEIGIPNKQIRIVGNSGVPTNYSELFYITYLAINFVTLLLAVFLLIRWLKIKGLITNTDSFSTLITITTILIVVANELTKTFFWTPHSQMFNILLPIYSLYLNVNQEKLRKSSFFNLQVFFIAIGLFFYSLIGIAFIILLLSKYRTIKYRLFSVLCGCAPWIAFPILIKLFGGNYQSLAIGHYREFIWVVDGVRNGDLIHVIKVNYSQFLGTFPLIPTLLISLGGIVMMILRRRGVVTLEKVPIRESLYLFFYFFIFSLMGYYARRVTLGPMIYL